MHIRHIAIAAVSILTVLSNDANALDLSGWANRAKLEVPGYSGSSTLNNFPLLVILQTNTPGFRYEGVIDAGGDDLRFVDAALETFLNHEVEEWNSNASSYVWVQIPTLQPAPPTIWVVWGNPSETNPATYSTNGATWDGTFKEVWHLDQTNGVSDLRDSTASEHHGVNAGSLNATGRISYGQVGAHISVPEGQDRPIPNTLSCWFKTLGDFYWLFDYNYQNPPYNILAVDGWFTDGHIISYENAWWGETGIVGDQKIDDGVWHHVTYVRTPGCDPGSGTGYIYIDGVPIGSGNFGPQAACGNHSFLNLNKQAHADSYIDEARVQNVQRSDDWIQAEWASVVSNDTYIAFTDMVSNMPAIVLSPTNGYLRGKINWTTDVAATTFICWGTNDAGREVAAWGNVDELGAITLGPFSNMTYFAPDRLYYFRCFVSNSVEEYWAEPADFFVTSEVFIEAPDNLANETGPDTAEFRIFRNSAVTSVALTVPYLIDGTAIPGSDYLELDGIAYLPIGVTSTTITVQPLDDDVLEEPPETVQASLETGRYYPIGSPGSATAVIEDNDLLRNWQKCLYLQSFGYDRDTTLSNFPALVKFADGEPPGFDYSDFASPNAYDLRFLDGHQTDFLSYEIEEWDTNGSSYIWVKVPMVESASSGIWAIWANDEMTNPTALSTNRAVWTESFQGVWHLQATNGTTAFDSSPAPVNGTTQNMGDDDWTNGIAANGVELDGVNQRITIPTGESETEMTHSLWVKLAADATNRGLFAVTDGGSGGDRDIFTEGSNVVARLEPTENIQSTNDVMTNDEWHFIAHTFGVTVGGQRLYVDGELQDTGTNTYSDFTSDSNIRIGYAPEASNDYTFGQIDEVRVSTVPRSEDWIWATWINIMSNDTFWLYGHVHQCGGSVIVVR